MVGGLYGSGTPSFTFRRSTPTPPKPIPGSMEALLEEKIEREAAEAEAQRPAAYVAGLHRERAGVVQQLAGVALLPPAEKVPMPLTAPHDWPTAAELASDLTARVAAIDAEVQRVGK